MKKDPGQLESVHRDKRYALVRQFLLTKLNEYRACKGGACNLDIGPDPKPLKPQKAKKQQEAAADGAEAAEAVGRAPRCDVGPWSPPRQPASIAPRAAELAPEAESGRRLPAELVASISDAGLFRMLVPADVGGGEAEPAQLVDAISELARGDGSAGWCLAVAATSGMLGAYVPREAAQEIFGDERGRVRRRVRPDGARRRRGATGQVLRRSRAAGASAAAASTATG